MADKQPSNSTEQRPDHLERWLQDSRNYLQLPFNELARLARKDNKIMGCFVTS